MSESALRTDGSLEAQPKMGVRNLHNFIYCPRLFYFQWIENVFQENADTVVGSHVHRNVDAPSRLDDPRELGLPEGAKLRSLRLESEALGLIGVVDIVEGGAEGAEIIDCKKGSARRNSEGDQRRRQGQAITLRFYGAGPGPDARANSGGVGFRRRVRQETAHAGAVAPGP